MRFGSSWTARTRPANRRPERRPISTTASLTGDDSALRPRHLAGRRSGRSRHRDQPTTRPSCYVRPTRRVSFGYRVSSGSERRLADDLTGCVASLPRTASTAPTICLGERSGLGTAPSLGFARTTEQNRRRVLPRRAIGRGGRPGADLRLNNPPPTPIATNSRTKLITTSITARILDRHPPDGTRRPTAARCAATCPGGAGPRLPRRTAGSPRQQRREPPAGCVAMKRFCGSHDLQQLRGAGVELAGAAIR